MTALIANAERERALEYQRALDAMRAGVRIRDPRNISIRGELHCGQDVDIDLNVIIEGRVVLGSGVKVEANCILINATIGDNTIIRPFSMVDNATVGANGFIGPYGRVRPASSLGDRVQVGNFVEIKNSEIGNGSRINHLSFIGDATLAENVTIGAGTITCNHNRVGVARTKIDANAYIGSGTELVAPLKVGESATIAAGSTITEDVPANKLTVARARQVTVNNWLPPEQKQSTGDG